MCFFYALSKAALDLKNRYQLKLEFEFEFETPDKAAPMYYASGFDYPRMPVITGDQPDRLQLFAWGLIPSWVKTPAEAMEIRGHTLNARSDTVFAKPSFRNSIRRRRCLIPAEGFYEWRLFQGRKYPYYISLKDQAVFSFAGIWDQWVDSATGELLQTYSILTTDANPLLEKIHNTKKRMPVILPLPDEKTWLQPDLDEAGIRGLSTAYDHEAMTAHTVSRLITARGQNRNVPAVRESFKYAELADL